MPRARIIKPEFWDDEKMSTISRDARLVFIAMWNLSDDYGVVKGNVAWLNNRIFPYENIAIDIFKHWVSELERIGIILPFKASNEIFFVIKNFCKHQTINRPSQTRNPEPPSLLSEYSMSTHDILIDEYNINRSKVEVHECSLSNESSVSHDQKNKEVAKEIKTPKSEKYNLKESFNLFWNEYPRKAAKVNAEKAWKKIMPNNGTYQDIMIALKKFKKSEQWLEKDGKFIPYPATWLNGKRWEEESVIDIAHVTLSQEKLEKISSMNLDAFAGEE